MKRLSKNKVLAFVIAIMMIAALFPTGIFSVSATIAQGNAIEDAEDFAQWMLTDFRLNGETTMITPALSFYKTEGIGKNHVRIAYVLEVPELKKALNVLAEGLKKYKETHP